MPRKKSFDPEVVLQKILFLFWEKGYESTSLRDIDQVSGIIRTSLYNAFNSKEKLFKDVLMKYTGMVENTLKKFLEDQDVDSLKNPFKNFLREDWDTIPKQFHFGCLMVNTSIASRTLDNSIISLVEDYELMWRSNFLETLESARSKKQIKETLDLEECANFLVSVLFGNLVRVRLARSLSVGASAARIVFETIDSWKT